MAKERFDPEIRSSMKGGGKPRPSQVRTRPGGPPKKVAPTEGGGDAPPSTRIPPQGQQPMQPMQGMPPDGHHVQAAAGIAHAILGKRGM